MAAEAKPAKAAPKANSPAASDRKPGMSVEDMLPRHMPRTRAARSPRNRRQKTAMANHRRRRRNPPGRARRRLPWPAFLPRRGLRNLAGRRPRRKRRPLRWPAKGRDARGKGFTKAAPEAKKVGGPRDTQSILAAARKGANRVRCRRPRPPPRQVRQKKTRPRRRSTNCPRCPRSRPMPSRWRRRARAEGENRRGFLGVMLGSFLALGFSSLALTNLLWLLVRASCFPTCSPSRRAFKVGSRLEFPPGQVETKFKVQFGVWIVNTNTRASQSSSR